MYIDSHAHINFKEYEGEIEDVLKRSFEAGVKKIVNVGSNYKTSVKTVEMVKDVRDIKMYATVGCHPIHLVKDIVESAKFDGKEYKFTTKKEVFNWDKYYNLAKSSDKIVGIGEVGIDIYRLEDEKHDLETILKTQKEVFGKFIDMAKELNLPLVIHSRGKEKDSTDVYKIIYNILEEKKYYNGVIHSYVGNMEYMKKFIDLGFYIGVNGIATFKNAQEVQEVVKEVPLDKLLLETDCPFLAPDPYRGKRNEPMYIPTIAKKIAELKDISVDEIEKKTTKNSEKLFGI